MKRNEPVSKIMSTGLITVHHGDPISKARKLLRDHGVHHIPVVNGHKIAGSAQRKHKGALLQHGSILLQRSPFSPALPGILELTGKHITRDELAIALSRRTAVETGWHLHPGHWTDDELALRERIELEKYGSPAWNAKR